MSKRGQVIFALLISMVLGSAVVWFFHNFEQVEEEVAGEFSGALRENQFLVLERFLGEMDLEVRAGGKLDHMRWKEEELGSTVVLGEMGSIGLADEQREALIELVEAGLHLVLVAPHGDSGLHRQLLDELGVEQEVVCSRDLPQMSWEDEEEPARRGLEELISAENGQEYDLGKFATKCVGMVPRGADFIGYDEEEMTLAVASAARGEGRLTVMMEWQWLRNKHLGDGEQGQMLADLLSLQGEWPQVVVLSLWVPSTGWMKIVQRRAWPIFMALFVFLILGLSRARRFGPMIPEPDRRRRRRAEHVEATGRFLWTRGSSEVLLEATRRALFDAVARRRPSIRTLSQRDQTKMMAEELGVAPQEMWRLLREDGYMSGSEEFRRTISRLEELRRRL